MKNEIKYNLLSVLALMVVIGIGCWGFACWSSMLNQNNGGNVIKQMVEQSIPSLTVKNLELVDSIDSPTKGMSPDQEKDHPYSTAIFTALGILLVTLVVKLGERLDILISSAIQILYEKSNQ